MLRSAPVLFLAAVAACAPVAEPVTGPIAEAVEAALASGSASFHHDAWDRLLREGTRDGLVDYGTFGSHRAELDAYLESVASARISSLAPGELKALLANAYNALTIRSILDHPGVSSIREIDGVWDTAEHRVGGYDLTLDAIEHRILRPFFKDPRVHFALNCASMSCAPLPPWAFDGSRIEDQLEERRRLFLSDPRQVRVEDGTLHLSKYFDWYGDDFVTEGWLGAAGTIAGYIKEGTRPEVAAFIESHHDEPPTAFIDYDWSLNAAHGFSSRTLSSHRGLMWRWCAAHSVVRLSRYPGPPCERRMM